MTPANALSPIHLLRLFTAAVAAGVVTALAAIIWWDHQSVRRDAENSLLEVARLMEEHTRAALLAGQIQLNRVADLVGDRPMPALRGSVADWAALRRIMADIPHADSFWLFDRDGDLVLSTLRPDGVTLSAADREYFTAVQDGADLFISPRIWGKLYGGFYFALSRPLAGPNGKVKGVVQFSVKDSYFLDFYRTLRPEDGASFTILKSDGSLVVRYPEYRPGDPTPPKHLPTFMASLASGDTGTYQVLSEFDGIERIYAYRGVIGYPLVVLAGLPVEVVYAGWADRTIRNSVLAAGALAAFLLIAWQLTCAFQREEKARTEAQSLLADKEVLFQEIHHRVKNNLQIISSFLTMQAVTAKDPATAAAVEESLGRIHSMGLVHQILYEQNEASDVSMEAYLRALAASDAQSFGADAVAIEVTTDGTRLPLDAAVPLALFANEALTNALKHAFPDGRGTIRMTLGRRDGRMVFAISDDGIGLPDGGDTGAGRGLGMHILKALARQLDAELRFLGPPGTTIELALP